MEEEKTNKQQKKKVLKGERCTETEDRARKTKALRVTECKMGNNDELFVIKDGGKSVCACLLPSPLILLTEGDF